jgi:glucokinase
MPSPHPKHDHTPDLIVADVGGTNGRFAVAKAVYTAAGGRIELSQVHTFPVSDYPAFEALLADYLDKLGQTHPRHACLSTAGPGDSRQRLITNLGWSVDAAALERQFALKQVVLANDFQALAQRLLLVSDADCLNLNETRPAAGPCSVIGPGTGLGVALLTRRGMDGNALASEGGHMTFAPITETELALRDSLAQDHEHVHAELLLSGPGLERIYQFLLKRDQLDAPALSAAAISDAALTAQQPQCREAVQLFLSILGSVAGDIALIQGAVGGVYFGGGILPRIQPLLADSDLCQRFSGKGVMHDYLAKIPLNMVTLENAALEGAAMLFLRS